MSRESILARLQQWFAETTGAECDPAAPYASTPGFDSFDAIQLVAFVESTFGIRLQAAELQSESFRTLDGLSRIIESKRP